MVRRTYLHGSSTTHGTGAQVAGRSLVVGLLVGILHMVFVDRLAVVLQSQRPEVRQSVKRGFWEFLMIRSCLAGVDVLESRIEHGGVSGVPGVVGSLPHDVIRVVGYTHRGSTNSVSQTHEI